MNYKILIYKDNKFYKEINLKKINGKIYEYKWENVEAGSYYFEIENENGERKGVTYNHTVPFATEFQAVVETTPKNITGFQNGIDVLIEYNDKSQKIVFKKTKFFKMLLNIEDIGLTEAKTVKISGSFNEWSTNEELFFDNEIGKYKIILAIPNGVYEYKYLIDDKWYPEGDNLRLVVGENGELFPKGEVGNGKFSFEPLRNGTNQKAIVHDYKNLKYFNKISEREYEFKIRTQINDVERVHIIITLEEEGNFERVFELERTPDTENKFDYFQKIIDFGKKISKLSYYFVLEDGGIKAYFDGEKLTFDKPKRLQVDVNEKDIQVFNIPEWSKEAIWYNIFPDRFYNGDSYNDPVFNEFGPESFEKNELHEQNFIESYKWTKIGDYYGKFDRNRWTADFSKRVSWEEKGEQRIDYSLKYARMYGGDLKGIKEKIPYIKELGINAVWLNPVFFSYQNHKYGTNDFRHISPDFGTIRISGEKYNVEIDKNNPYGSKSYVEVLGKKAINNSELKLLEVKLNGKDKGKNGYGENEDPRTWVWTESDLIMVDLIKEFHKNGIRVIFDGVFNHSSDRHWTFNMVLADGEESKYRDWYKFNDFTYHEKITDNMSDKSSYEESRLNKYRVKYNSWAGFDSLPEFNSFNEGYKEYIFNITKKWMLGPDGKSSENWHEDDGIDGWRLDVPNCLGNQTFWNEWREIVKTTKKEAYITAELWGNASSDINNGNKFDTVMNYEWLKTVIGFFINQGSEGGDTYKLKATDFFNELREKRGWYPYQALQSSQNLNGSHDTDRLYSRIVNDKLGRNLEEGKQLDKGYNGIRPDLASNYHPNTTIDWKNNKIKPKDILKLISIFQMTYIGAPMLFYGDEVGMWGATDPYCRKPMLWSEFIYDDEKNPSNISQGEIYSQMVDYDLLQWYKKIIKIRKENKELIYGKFKEVCTDNEKDIIAYERIYEDKSVMVIINNSFNEYEDIVIKTDYIDKKYIDLLTGNSQKTDNNGKLKINLEAKQGVILKNWN